jgi:hypothetical protein
MVDFRDLASFQDAPYGLLTRLKAIACVVPVGACRFLEPELVTRVAILPAEPPRPITERRVTGVKLSKRAHLAIDVCVPEQQVFALQATEVGIGPVQAERVLRLGHQPSLIP